MDIFRISARGSFMAIECMVRTTLLPGIVSMLTKLSSIPTPERSGEVSAGLTRCLDFGSAILPKILVSTTETTHGVHRWPLSWILSFAGAMIDHRGLRGTKRLSMKLT
jgi:hypothetical protein